VKKSWVEATRKGWAAFTFKEKLKKLKLDMRRWNNESFGDVDNQIEKVMEDMNCLEKREKEMILNEEEEARKRLLNEEF